MYYFDNAATSWPKPISVLNGVKNAVMRFGANPNRGDNTMSREAGRVLLNCRKKLCVLFSTDDPFEYIFTLNTTHALNYAIKGFLKPGMNALVTSLEHNSVLRPLEQLKNNDIGYEVISVSPDGIVTPRQVKEALKPNTNLLIISHVSNVLGTIQPIEEIISIAHRNGTAVLLDAAQSAGMVELDLSRIKVDMAAFPGHKGLYGLQGTGVLFVRKGTLIDTIIEGGTGSESKLLTQPDVMPDKFEAGTVNLPGIAALSEAVSFILSNSVGKIRQHECGLASFFYDELKKISNVVLYGTENKKMRTGICTFNIDGKDPSYIEELLDSKYRIAIRSGFHCAPLAHKTIGTYETGACRFSFGFYNDEKQIEYAVKAVRDAAK